MFSSSAFAIQDSSASEAPRCCQEARSLDLASATRRALSACLIWKIVAGSAATASQAGASSASHSAAPAWCPFSARLMISGATQVGPCTPLVIEPIGTSAVSKPGHSPVNISLLTWPCSVLTPLTRWASRIPITAMLNRSGLPPS